MENIGTRPYEGDGRETVLLEKRKAPDASNIKPILKWPEAGRSTMEPKKSLARPVRTVFTEKTAVSEERHGEIEYRVVTNNGTTESTVILTALMIVFQNQLPNMPAGYIARLVFDRNHRSLAIVKPSLEVVGGITYREFRDRGFVEIAFVAVAPGQQVKGYGAHMMAHLKDYIKATSSVMHLLTYADNLAVGYFRKQGFTNEVTLPESIWRGCIKDYQGVTLVQCTMLPRIRYLEVGRMLLKQKETVLAKVRTLNKNHVVHQPPKQWSTGNITPINPLDIPAIRETGWSPAMDELARQPRRGPHFYEMRRFLSQVQSHKQAWPFLRPVDVNEVPDYYLTITSPMDLSTMETKLENGEYSHPRFIVEDMKLMFRNCRQFNDPSTVYVKCANAVERYMRTLVRETPEWASILERQKAH